MWALPAASAVGEHDWTVHWLERVRGGAGTAAKAAAMGKPLEWRWPSASTPCGDGGRHDRFRCSSPNAVRRHLMPVKGCGWAKCKTV